MLRAGEDETFLVAWGATLDDALICHLQDGRLGDGELVANPASFRLTTEWKRVSHGWARRYGASGSDPGVAGCDRWNRSYLGRAGRHARGACCRGRDAGRGCDPGQ